MKKHAVKIAILAVWIALMGWWWHESRSWPVPEKIETAFLPDFYDSFSLNFNEQKVGWAYKSLRRQSNGDYQGSQGTTLRVRVAGQALDVTSTVLVNMSPSLNLKDFQYLIQAGDLAVSERGAVTGDKLAVTVNLGEYAPMMKSLAEEFGPMLGEHARLLNFDQEVTLPAPEGPGLAAIFPPFLSHLGLTIGRNYSLATLDAFSRTIISTNMRVDSQTMQYDPESGRDQPVYQIRSGTSGQETFLWIDRYGRTVREEGLGLSLDRVYDQATAMRDIEPLTPPATFQRLLQGRNFNRLLETIESRRSGREKQAGRPDDNKPNTNR